MAVFENVSIFSQTTAEISKEYVDKFHEPNIMPNYLYDLTVKNDVELFSRDGVYEVKGSWMSVNRVHSFLGQFLLTYGQSRIEALTSPPETTCTKEDDDGTQEDDDGLECNFDVDKTKHSNAGDKNLKKILRVSICNPGNANYINQDLPTDKLLLKSNKQTPAPVVLYAGFTEELESQRKTLEVLRNVYKMDQNDKITQSVASKRKDVSEECAPASATVIMVIPTENEALVEDQPSYSSSKTEGFDQQNHQKVPSEEDIYTEDEEGRKHYIHSIPASLGHGSSVEPQTMTKLKEPGIYESSSSGTRKPSFVKSISEEQTAAKRKKVESIADSILSQVPNKEKNNVCKVVNENREDSTSLIKQERVEDNYDDGNEIEPVALSNDEGDDDDDDDDDYGPSENDDENSNESEEDKSSFKPDAADKDTPVETEAESVDECEQEIQPTSDIDYVPDEKITTTVTTRVKAARKMKTRSKARDKDISLLEQSPKKGRGRPRKGFPMKLETNKSMKASMKSESGKSKNTGKKAVKGSTSKNGRRKHRGSESTGEVFCSKCPYFASKQSHLREHERRVHITKKFNCEQCDRIFGFGKDLKRHLKTHRKPQNCCDVCGKLYKGVKSLVEHRKTHDDGYVKPEFECEICKKCFSTKYVLAYHIKSEHLGMKRTFMCPTCGKSFSQKNSYVQHANVHMGFKPYKCDFCDKAFSYEKSLKEHRFMHDEIRRFKCTVCDKTFRQSSAVSIHMKVHKATKDYVCMACGRGFSQKQALIRHERIHLGEKPFSCGLCGRNFTDSSVLRRHMILIHKKDPKKWQEHMINNCVGRTDFFIDVLPGVTESEQTSEGNSKGMDTCMEEGGLGTISPNFVDTPPTPRSEPINRTSTTPTLVPINMTTQSQSSPREEIHIEGFSGRQTAAEAEETVDHPYSLNVEQIQPESTAELHNQATPLLHPKMATVVHPELIQSHGLQTSLDDKSLVGEYIAEGLSAQPMPYIVGQQSQGAYPYEQMVVLSDNRSQYTSLPPPPAMNYQQQYTTDPNSSQPYSGYPPPQS